jgi:hypothetical protein
MPGGDCRRLLAFFLALAGLITGIIAAATWAKAAKVAVAAPYGLGSIPPAPDVEIQGWTIGMLGPFSENARLNFRAAR